MVLSGMSSMEQVKENIALAEKARVNSLSPAELGLYEKVRAKYEEITVIPCTKCGYCMPCPQGVDILGNLNNYNEGYVYGRPDMARGLYGWWENPGGTRMAAWTGISVPPAASSAGSVRKNARRRSRLAVGCR